MPLGNANVGSPLGAFYSSPLNVRANLLNKTLNGSFSDGLTVLAHYQFQRRYRVTDTSTMPATITDFDTQHTALITWFTEGLTLFNNAIMGSATRGGGVEAGVVLSTGGTPVAGDTFNSRGFTFVNELPSGFPGPGGILGASAPLSGKVYLGNYYYQIDLTGNFTSLQTPGQTLQLDHGVAFAETLNNVDGVLLFSCAFSPSIQIPDPNSLGPMQTATIQVTPYGSSPGDDRHGLSVLGYATPKSLTLTP